MRSIALDPEEVTETLSVGLSVDHIMAISVSPVMGITSATVPTAARSRYRRNTSPALSGPATAMANFRATPTPARPLKG